MSLSCTINEIVSLLPKNLRMSRDTSHIPFEFNISHMYKYSYVPISTRFSDSKDMIGAKFKENGSPDPDHAH